MLYNLLRIRRSISARFLTSYARFAKYLYITYSNILFVVFRRGYIENISDVKNKKVRTKPTFLIVRYKYAHGDKKLGNSNEYHAVMLPLASSGICDIEEIYYDVDYLNPSCGNKKLINIIKHNKPDLIILSSYSPDQIIQPKIDLLKLIKNNANIPFINIWHDSVGFVEARAKLIKSELIDLHVLLDSGYLIDKVGEKDKHKYIRLWAPIDQTFFNNNRKINRDIDVSFMGSTSSYRSIRRSYLDYLENENVDVYRGGGQRDEVVSLEEYASVLKRSKMSINFSFSVHDQSQLKVRVFEILYCGALMLESKNEETCKYFIPGVDYVEYESKEDLLEKIKYYSVHEDERERIASNGHQKAISKYSHNQFWEKITSRMAENNLFVNHD